MAESNIEIHTRVGNDHQNWTATAETLFEGSKVLKHVSVASSPGKRQSTSFSAWIEIMLTAFGIECLIKAIWIRQGHQLARDGKYIGMGEKEPYHQLVKLCERAEIALDPLEADVLERMSDIATSIGRYPIPQRAGQSEGVRSWSSQDDGIIEKFVVKLRTQLQ